MLVNSVVLFVINIYTFIHILCINIYYTWIDEIIYKQIGIIFLLLQ